MSECQSCKHEFVSENPRKIFCTRKCYHDYWYSLNKEKKKVKSRLWESRNPTNLRRKKLKFYYGMTVEQYDKMNEDQNGVCKICKRLCPSGRKLSVDHCHVSGKIRGLLCMKCNKGLGSFEDSLDNMKSAIQYLEENKP